MRRRDNGEIDDTLLEKKSISCGKYMRNIFHIRHRIEQNRTEQNRTEQNRTEQNRTEWNRIEQNITEWNRIEQNRTEWNRKNRKYRKEIKEQNRTEWNRKNRKEKKEQNGKDSKEFSRKQDIKSRTLTELHRCLSQNEVELDSIK